MRFLRWRGFLNSLGVGYCNWIYGWWKLVALPDDCKAIMYFSGGRSGLLFFPCPSGIFKNVERERQHGSNMKRGLAGEVFLQCDDVGSVCFSGHGFTYTLP